MTHSIRVSVSLLKVAITWLMRVDIYDLRHTINNEFCYCPPLNANCISRFYRNNTLVSFVPYFSPSCLTSGEKGGGRLKKTP